MSPVRPLVVGNWKMNLDHVEAIHLTQQLGVLLRTISHEHTDVIVMPPFVDLRSVSSVMEADRLPMHLGAQHVSQFEGGAYTGEISVEMLKRLGVKTVLVGHSERRQHFHMDDDVLMATFETVLRAGLTPLLCIGESQEIRDGGRYAKFVAEQIRAVMNATFERPIMVAYEPLWAIGTGTSATTEQVAEMVDIIRHALPLHIATSTPVLYGGSVNAANAHELAQNGDVNGFLVGGASLKADEFVAIVAATNDCYPKSR